MNRLESVQQLLNIEHKEYVLFNESEESGVEVHRIHDVWILFEIPQFGGFPGFVGSFMKWQLEELIRIANSFT